MSVKSELKDFLSLVANTFDAYTAALFMAREDGLALTDFVSMGDNIRQGASFTHADGGLVGWVAKNNKPLNLSHFEKKWSQLFPFYLKEEPLKSFMAVPLSGGKGVLVADSKKRLSYSDKDLKLLNDFARVIDHTLAAAESRTLAKEQAGLLELLEKTEYRYDKTEPGDFFTLVLREMRGFTGTDLGFVALKAEDGGHYFLHTTIGPVPPYLMDAELELFGNLVGQILRNGSPVVHGDTSRLTVFPALFMPGEEISPVRSFLATPLKKRGEIKGALGFAGFRPAAISGFHESALFALAERCVLALEFFLKKRDLFKARWTDPVTALYNRPSFLKLLERRLKTARDEEGSLALIVVELQGLGGAGAEESPWDVDRVLATIAGVIAGKAPAGASSATLARDRFGLLVPGLYQDKARLAADEICKAASRVLRGESGALGGVEVRAGVAGFPHSGNTVESLWRAAHRALVKTGFNL